MVKVNLIESNKRIILDAWKKATEHNNRELGKLKKEYNVEYVKGDECGAIYKHNKTNEEFVVDFSGDFYELSDENIEFAKKHESICNESFDIAERNIDKAGFDQYDIEEFYTLWRKEGYEYSVPHYVNKIEDIECLSIAEIEGHFKDIMKEKQIKEGSFLKTKSYSKKK